MFRRKGSGKTRLPGHKARPVWLDWTLRAALFILSIAMTTFILAYDVDKDLNRQDFQVGEPAPRTLFAPFEMAYVDELETRLLRDRVMAGVVDVYRLDPDAGKLFISKVDALFEYLNQLKTAGMSESPMDLSKIPLQISEGSARVLLQEEPLEDIRKNIQMIFERLPGQGVLADEDKAALQAKKAEKISLLSPDVSQNRYMVVNDIPSVSEAVESAIKYLPESAARKRSLRNAITEVFKSAVKQDLIHDPQETDRRRQLARASVAPIQAAIKKDELIVQRGRLVSSEEKQRIDQIQKKKKEEQIIKKASANALLVLVIYSMLFAYLLFFHRKKLFSFRMLFLFHTVFLVNVFLCKAIRVWPESSAYLMPGALAPLLLALLVRPSFGFFAAIMMAALVSPLAGFGRDMTLAILLSGCAGTLACFKVRKRMEFLRVGLVVGLTSFAVLFAWRLYQEATVYEAFQVGLLGLMNGVLITIPCLFILLPVFESAFNLATDITLLELSDLNHPLLKKMIIEAPGTYHHSLVVSRLAEGACEDIRANALLARVGCYFHDIGKMARSQFFTENNTMNLPSKHEKLTPTMSCLIIINHVKEGLDLGRKYKLKQSVLNFIPEHQGTGVVYYFYRRALDQAAPGERVDPNEFRYPGPKPQSRETAIAMLADSTEAASRSMKSPSPDAIGAMVRKIINDKFIDGQLDECDLTLKDLHKIQESFVRNLTAILHSRISYPEKPETSDKPDLFQGGEFQKYRV